MKLFITPLVILMVFVCTVVYAQDFCIGARTRSLGNAGVADTSAWSILNNPAGMSHIKDFHAIICNEYLYGINQIRSFAAGIIFPLKKSYILGFHANKQGYEWFNDQQIGLHIAHTIRLYSLSASFIVWQRVAGEHFREIYPIVNIGGTMSVNKFIQLGLHIFNISNTQHSSADIPLEVKAGMHYKISRQIHFYGDLVKLSTQSINLRTGLEYHIHTHFYIRCGVMLNPMRMNGGLGFSNKRMSIDYSVAWQNPLGYRHQIALQIQIKKRI
jgi:hypothetical protein